MLDEAFKSNISLDNGRAIAQLFYGKVFHSNYSDYYIDATALRITAMVIKDFDPNTTSCRVII